MSKSQSSQLLKIQQKVDQAKATLPCGKIVGLEWVSGLMRYHMKVCDKCKEIPFMPGPDKMDIPLTKKTKRAIQFSGMSLEVFQEMGFY